MELAFVDGAIAEEAHHSAIAASLFDGESEACRDRKLAADDSMAAHEVTVDIKDVHRSAFASAGASCFSAQFSHCGFGVDASGQRMTVVSIVRYHVVLNIQNRDGANGHRFFADVQVQEPSDQALQVEPSGGLLEAPDHQHLSVIIGRLSFVDIHS